MSHTPPPTPPGPSAANLSAYAELERLREVEEHLRFEIEHLRDAVSDLERGRDAYFELYDWAAVALFALDQHRVIQHLNRAAAQLLGGDRKLLIGHLLSTFVSIEDRPILNRHLLSSRQLNGVSSDLRLRLAPDFAPVRLSSRMCANGFADAAIVVAIWDDRENAEALSERHALVASEMRSRRESESKDQFIAMLSHELRTPLTPILVASSTLKDDPNIEPRLRDVFRRISRNANAEARLIDDLLDATGILRGKMMIVSAPVDMHELLIECVDALRPDATHKQQQIQLDLEAANFWVTGDTLRLRQVFTNLLRNAIKFTPPGGQIQLRSWNGENRLAIDVEDSGIGFAPESARRLFEPFDQLAENNRAGGLGLGLAIAKGLVELHQGKIEASSRGPGKGARFVVNLLNIATPAVTAPSHSSAVSLAPPKSGQHLLLVEDHVDSAEMLTELLELKGYFVVVAHSVAEALAQDNAEIDVIVSDLGLPDGTGMDLIRQLQAKRHRPAIALSGFGMDGDVQAAKRAGFDLHLTKPVSATRLLEALQTLSVRIERDV